MIFDIVVRLRNDIPINVPLDTDIIKDFDQYIYARPFHLDVEPHDMFAIGNSRNMNLYAQCFDGFIRGEYFPWISMPEKALAEHLKRVDVKWKPLPFSFI